MLLVEPNTITMTAIAIPTSKLQPMKSYFVNNLVSRKTLEIKERFKI